jgi:hypothetical protein
MVEAVSRSDSSRMVDNWLCVGAEKNNPIVSLRVVRGD